MSEENLVRQCAPTLAGIKTGTIFPVPFDSLPGLTAEIRDLNRILVPKGLRLLPLRYQDRKALLYLYRPSELRKDLKDQLAGTLLAEAGYPNKGSEQCVLGFIENRAVNYKCAGLWKVYGDVEQAQRLFARYRKCTDIYCELWRAGSGIGQLAVAV